MRWMALGKKVAELWGHVEEFLFALREFFLDEFPQDLREFPDNVRELAEIFPALRPADFLGFIMAHQGETVAVLVGVLLLLVSADMGVKAWQRWKEFEALPKEKRLLYKKAKKLVKKGEYLVAGQIYEGLEDREKALEAYKWARADESAARMYEQLQQWGKAAALYESLKEYDRAGEMYQRNKNYHKAAQTFLHAGKDLLAAEMHEKGKEYLAAARIYEGCGLFHKASLMYLMASETARAAELFERHAKEEAGKDRTPGERNTIEDYAKKNGERCLHLGRHGDAARIFLAAGLLTEAANAHLQAQDYEKAAELYLEAKEYEKASQILEKVSNVKKGYLMLAEMHVQQGRFPEAAEKFEKAGEFKRAGEMYEKGRNLMKAAEAYELSGEHGRAGEMFKAAGDNKRAAQTLEKGRRLREAARLYESLGDPERAARLLEENGDYHEAAETLKRMGKDEEAKSLFRKADIQSRTSGPQTGVDGGVQKASSSAAIQETTRYRIVREVGRGGMGVVYQAEDLVLKRTVAYKILPESVRDNPRVLERFLQEARTAAQLNHPNIVTVYDSGKAGEDYYITMEFIEGITLKALVEQGASLSMSLVLMLTRQICAGLDFAHSKNVIHRDLKPANIMIARDHTIKIMDFGLAKVMTEAAADKTSVKGTPLYMSPEQILGTQVDHRCDIYALGCTIYCMACGKPPFTEGDVYYHHLHTAPAPPKDINTNVPDALNAVILKCLEKDKARRYDRVKGVMQELENTMGA